MKRIATLLSTVSVGLLCAWPLSADVVGTRAKLGLGKGGMMPGEVVVQFSEGLDEANVTSLVRLGGGRDGGWRSRFSRGLRLVKLNPGDSVERALQRYGSMPGVEFAEPNYLRKLHVFQPNDPLFRLQWNMRLVGANRAWDIQQGAASVTVAVIDSGAATQDHAAFPLTIEFEDGSEQTFTIGPFKRTPDWGSTRFAPGYDAIIDAGFAWDDDGHGTHTSSTVAESANNGVGVTGLAFGVTLMPIKACFSLPWIDPDLVGCPSLAVADGIDHARSGGAKVINLSLGGEFPSEAERQAVQRAAGANIVIVASSGNDDGPVGYPAAFPQVIAVGAVNGRRQRAFYSNFGPELDLVAPGGDPFDDADNDGTPDFVFQQTIDPDLAAVGDYTSDVTHYWGFIGTSMSSPHVAAAAALLISQGITDAAAVRAALEQTADDLGAAGRDDRFGHGLINPTKALSGLGLNR